jgi:ribonuclease P/MRP protein subunit RPP40
VSQLLEQYEKILDALRNKSNMDIIMLDYSKAFDKINHSILLFKLRKLGISGNLAKWIGHFLLNRTQRVSINGYLSQPSQVTSGVPQGTILGPILFLIYIADIGDNLTECTLSSYADDSKAHKIINTINDGLELQTELHKLYSWTDTNLMEFNSEKFEVLRIGGNQMLKEEIKYKTPEGDIIKETELAKDLGVYFNNKGHFGDHIKIKSVKAKQMSGYILRTFITRKPEIMLTLLKSLVLPIIEYSCIIWNPHTQQDISQLESVQRNFTCKLDGMQNMDYYQRLVRLKIYSAERRRDRYLIVYVFKIIFRKVPNPGLSYKWSLRRGKVLTIPAVLSSKPSRASTLMHHSFTRRAPRLFNALPKVIRNLPDDTPMDSVKNNIDKYLREITDEPRLPGYYPCNSSASNRVEDQIQATEFLSQNHL